MPLLKKKFDSTFINNYNKQKIRFQRKSVDSKKLGDIARREREGLEKCQNEGIK